MLRLKGMLPTRILQVYFVTNEDFVGLGEALSILVMLMVSPVRGVHHGWSVGKQCLEDSQRSNLPRRKPSGILTALAFRSLSQSSAP